MVWYVDIQNIITGINSRIFVELQVTDLVLTAVLLVCPSVAYIFAMSKATRAKGNVSESSTWTSSPPVTTDQGNGMLPDQTDPSGGSWDMPVTMQQWRQLVMTTFQNTTGCNNFLQYLSRLLRASKYLLVNKIAQLQH